MVSCCCIIPVGVLCQTPLIREKKVEIFLMSSPQAKQAPTHRLKWNLDTRGHPVQTTLLTCTFSSLHPRLVTYHTNR